MKGCTDLSASWGWRSCQWRQCLVVPDDFSHGCIVPLEPGSNFLGGNILAELGHDFGLLSNVKVLASWLGLVEK
jgi:hypothetical protein